MVRPRGRVGGKGDIYISIYGYPDGKQSSYLELIFHQTYVYVSQCKRRFIRRPLVFKNELKHRHRRQAPRPREGENK